MRNKQRPRSRVAIALALIALCLIWHTADLGPSLWDDTYQSSLEQPALPRELPCRSLPGANETLVVFRTGSTELEARFAVHLSTTLRCMPNYLIFSDLEEDYRGEHILNALADVDHVILQKNPDFELHRRLQDGGRAALDPTELAGSPDSFAKVTGHEENPGWKLDKWKFLPMVNKTLHERPDMKWYVFVEADSFILWSMLLQYLDKLDSTKPIYAGSQMFIADVLFAHGGSGFVVSRPALRTLVNHYAANKADIESFTDAHWAGDCVLGKTFTDSGVPFINAWPAFQSDYPGLVPYARADGPDELRRVWCYPTVSYHHMSPAMINDLWHWEQEWISKANPKTTDTIHHGDVFTDYVMPQMLAPREDWDNLSDNEAGTVATLDECRARCVADSECKQYSLDEDSMCRTRADPRLGKVGKGFLSGWLEDRIETFQRDMAMAACGSEGWQVS